jgi:protease I
MAAARLADIAREERNVKMVELNGLRVAVFATDGVEEAEIVEPIKALRDAGAEVTVISPKPDEIQAVQNDLDKTVKIPVDRSVYEASPVDFDAAHLPGGTVNADRMRVNPELQVFLRDLHEAGKPIAAICHAPWELISAGLVRGRTLTSYHTLQDDVRNAGGTWVDEPVAEDGTIVTSRQPTDIPLYNAAMLELFGRCMTAARSEPAGMRS